MAWWWRELGDGTVARERKTTREGRGVLGRPAYWAAETRWAADAAGKRPERPDW